jgi:hypothetical protein
MPITHVLVVTDGTPDSITLDITEVLAALPISDSTSLIVTDSVQSAITILAETSCTTGKGSSPSLGSRRLNG